MVRRWWLGHSTDSTHGSLARLLSPALRGRSIHETKTSVRPPRCCAASDLPKWWLHRHNFGMRTLFSLLVLAACGAGCANSQTVQDEPLSAGATRSFKADYQEVVDAARSSARDVGLSMKREAPSENGIMLIAERGVTAWSWGEAVRILILPHRPETSVRIVTDRAYALNVTAKDFAEDLFTRIGQRLGEYP